MAEFWATIVQQATGGSRTDVLRALIWPNAMLIAALVWASTKGAPVFVLILLSLLLVLFLTLYAVSYVVFGRKDPNLLRSEKFNIDKLAIEHGVYGDSVNGVIPTRNLPKQLAQLPAVDDNQ